MSICLSICFFNIFLILFHQIIIKELDLHLMAMLDEGGESKTFTQANVASLVQYISGIQKYY